MGDCPPCTRPGLGRGPLLTFQKPWVLSAWMLTPSSDSRTGCFVTFRISSNTSGNVPGGERLERPPVDPRTSFIGDGAPLVLTAAGRLSTPTWPAGWEELTFFPGPLARFPGQGGERVSPPRSLPSPLPKVGICLLVREPQGAKLRCRERRGSAVSSHPHRSEGGSD